MTTRDKYLLTSLHGAIVIKNAKRKLEHKRHLWQWNIGTLLLNGFCQLIAKLSMNQPEISHTIILRSMLRNWQHDFLFFSNVFNSQNVRQGVFSGACRAMPESGGRGCPRTME